MDEAPIDWRSVREEARVPPGRDRSACVAQLEAQKAALKGAASLAERCQLLASMAALKEHLALAAAPPPAGTAPPPPEVWEVFVAILDEVAAREDAAPQILHELAETLLVELGRTDKLPATPEANKRQLAVQQAAVDAVGEGKLNNLTRCAEPGHYSSVEALLRARLMLTWGRGDVDDPHRSLHNFFGQPSATLTRLVASLSSLMGQQLTDAEEDQAAC